MRLNNQNAVIFVPLAYPLGLTGFFIVQNNMYAWVMITDYSAVKTTSWLRSKRESWNKFQDMESMFASKVDYWLLFSEKISSKDP